MTTRVITSENQRQDLVKLIGTRPLPFTAEVVKGKRRSVEQNRLQRRLISEIASQTDQTPEEVRSFCKLTIGVPILRAGNEMFAEKYDRLVKPMPYERKLELMAEPIDFPVTRLMTTAMKTQYLEEIYRVFSQQGVVFTEDRERAQ
jgi:hypothetical protein